jgi:hypothetical protein
MTTKLIFRITECLDFILHPNKHSTTYHFRDWICFHLHVKGWEIPTKLDPLERDNPQSLTKTSENNIYICNITWKQSSQIQKVMFIRLGKFIIQDVTSKCRSWMFQVVLIQYRRIVHIETKFNVKSRQTRKT